MVLFTKQPRINQEKYLKDLDNMGKLSRLFSADTAAPYLVSRATENIFESALKAQNLGRDDTAIDAILDGVGVGIKTFLHQNGRTLQKVAEFNKDNSLYNGLSIKDKILKIAHLRNERLQFAMDNYDVKELMYHCITRKIDGTVNIYECPMDFIEIDKIKNVKLKNNSIAFKDEKNEYSFNLTKSTLYKRFLFDSDDYLVASIKVEILDDPFKVLNDLMNELEKQASTSIITSHSSEDKKFILLPLYSYSKSIGKYVPERSGLNQWNANGRKRHTDEAYIPISRKIHQAFPGFFPSRDTPFELFLPNRKLLSAKISQEGDKALMTNPNKDLGQWILRDVLHLPEKELLTYQKLAELGIDSVKIIKEDDLKYSIDFCEIGSYDDFAMEHNL